LLNKIINKVFYLTTPQIAKVTLNIYTYSTGINKYTAPVE